MKFAALITPPASSAIRAVSQVVDMGLNDRGSRGFSAARVCLVSLLLAAPLAFGAVQPWASAALIGLVVLAFFCWAAGCARLQSILVAWTPLYVPALLFLALAVVQLMSGRTADPTGARDSIIVYCAYILLFALTATLFANTQRPWNLLGKTVTVYTLLLSIFAILQFFTSPDKIYWSVVPRWGGSIFGPYVNRNHYAGLLEMLVALTATFWLGRRHRDLWNWLAGFATLIALASVALSGSRAGVGSVLFEMVLLGAVALLAQRRGQVASPVPALALALLCATLMAAWLSPPETTDRFRPTVNTQDASFADRVAMAADSLRVFRAHPFIGVGLGGFETAYPPFQSFASEKRIDHAHNDYAEALAETGTAGGILIVAALALFVSQAVKNFRASLAPTSDIVVWLRMGATIGCLGLLVHSFFDFNLHIPANAAWFAVCAGLAVTPLQPAAASRTAESQ
jgi:O-antigen ligase